jgi:hypothetical protein
MLPDIVRIIYAYLTPCPITWEKAIAKLYPPRVLQDYKECPTRFIQFSKPQALMGLQTCILTDCTEQQFTVRLRMGHCDWIRFQSEWVSASDHRVTSHGQTFTPTRLRSHPAIDECKSPSDVVFYCTRRAGRMHVVLPKVCPRLFMSQKNECFFLFPEDHHLVILIPGHDDNSYGSVCISEAEILPFAEELVW